METILQTIIDQAMKSGQSTTALLLAACAILSYVVIMLYKKSESLHKENTELLREMLDHSNEYNIEKTRLVEEINKTIAILLATLSQFRSGNNG